MRTHIITITQNTTESLQISDFDTINDSDIYIEMNDTSTYEHATMTIDMEKIIMLHEALQNHIKKHNKNK